MSFVPGFLSGGTGELGLSCHQCHSAEAKGRGSGCHSRVRKCVSRPGKAAKWFVAGPAGANAERLPFLDADGV